MKDRLFIEFESRDGKKYLMNIDKIIGIEDTGITTYIWISNGECMKTDEKFEDLKQRIYDLLQYGMKTDRNIDNT